MSFGTVLIVEPYATGHRGVWMRWISEQLVKHEWRVVIATLTQSLREPALAWLARESVAVEVVALERPAASVPGNSLVSLLVAQLRCYKLLERLCVEAHRCHRIDAVLLPYGDYAAHVTALLGSPFGRLPWIPIVMRQSFHYRDMGIVAPDSPFSALRRILFHSFVRTRSLAVCLTIDQPLYEFLRVDPGLKHKIRYLADPVDAIGSAGRTEARAHIGIPAGAVVVLVFGNLTLRKGMQYLLPAVCKLSRVDLHVLCVGVPDSDFRTLLNGSNAMALIRAGRLHVIDRWADPATEAAAFAVADIVWLGYFGHWQSSGVLVQAGRAQLPSLACDVGLIGWTVTRYQCGLVVEVRQRDAVAAALETLADSPGLRASLGRNGSQAFADNTTDNAGTIISDALQNTLVRGTQKVQRSSASGVGMPADVPDRWER